MRMLRKGALTLVMALVLLSGVPVAEAAPRPKPVNQANQVNQANLANVLQANANQAAKNKAKTGKKKKKKKCRKGKRKNANAALKALINDVRKLERDLARLKK
jgi:hypothetical protein